MSKHTKLQHEKPFTWGPNVMHQGASYAMRYKLCALSTNTPNQPHTQSGRDVARAARGRNDLFFSWVRLFRDVGGTASATWRSLRLGGLSKNSTR